MKYLVSFDIIKNQLKKYIKLKKTYFYYFLF